MSFSLQISGHNPGPPYDHDLEKSIVQELQIRMLDFLKKNGMNGMITNVSPPNWEADKKTTFELE